MNGLVFIAIVASIFGVQAAPQDSNTDKPATSVTAQAGRFSLGYNQGQGLTFGYNNQPQPQQPQYGAYAQSPYPYYPQPQPQVPQWNPQPQQPPFYPSYPSYYPGGYYQPPGGSYYQPQTRPNYNQESDNFKPPESGMVVEDADTNNQQPSISYPGNSGQMGMPSWSQSFTPMPGSGGCYNRCRPRCNFRPPPPPPPPMPRPPPPPPPMPMPRPLPMPMPMPRPPPQPQCRQVCRPQCNARPTCPFNTGAQLNGNTMTCGMQQPSTRPMYNGYGGYGNYGNYGNYYNQQPAPASVNSNSSPTSSESNSEAADEDTEENGGS